MVKARVFLTACWRKCNIYDENIILCHSHKRRNSIFNKVIPKTFGYILRTHPFHPEYKSLAPDGTPCEGNTRGLLQRMHVVGTQLRYTGKETERKWDHGEDLSLMTFRPAQFDEVGKTVKADPVFIENLSVMSIKEIVRKTNIDRNTIRKMLRGLPVRRATIQQVVLAFAE